MPIGFQQRSEVERVPEGAGWFVTVDINENGSAWTFNACVADRGQSEPVWDAIEADLRALAGDDYMRATAQLRQNEQPPLDLLEHSTIWVLGASQWRVTFSGTLNGAARTALSDAGILHTGGHSGRGYESNSVRVEALGAHDAVERARQAISSHGVFARFLAHWIADEHRL